ncbi:MAG: NADH:ubiquinone oxidoreductase subunit NDUFA12 [Pseudomonadota bacterium]
MKTFLLQFFTWWNGQTLGTRFHTWRHGERVGEDHSGNVYYRNADDSRRWVIYNGVAEASAIPSGWHGWMHHKISTPPSDQNYEVRAWEKPHQANPTGTPSAYRPKSSILNPEPKSATSGDYEAWTP